MPRHFVLVVSFVVVVSMIANRSVAWATQISL